MNRFDKEFIWSITGVIVVVILTIFLSRSCESTRCETRAQEMGLQHVYSLTSGCRVKLGDKTVPLDQVRFFEDGHIIVEKDK